MAHFQPSSFSEQFKSLTLPNVRLTGKNLGRGADATVQEVNWLGTLCAAKQLHETLLKDESSGGARRFIENFEKECMTWSKLIHPRIVQFLGVHFLSGSRVPMLILEKMDTSLRNYLEAHKKEEFPFPDKVYVLRQVAQALSYLHSLSPPLVHHDLSPNNVLLNDISLQAKVTDFGMTRALNPSKMSRKSSVKGTQAFMPPEGLVDPPKYDDKLDVFSYGNVIITTVTHQWPEPGPSKVYQGDLLIAVSELQRRQQYIDHFSQEEGALLLPTVRSCLEDRPGQRPNSIQLVVKMTQIEAAHPKVPDSVVIGQLCQAVDKSNALLRQKQAQLHLKDTELCQKDTQLRQKDTQLCQKDVLLGLNDAQLRQKDTQLRQKDTQLRQNDTQLRQKDTQLRQKDALLGQNDAQLCQKDTQLRLKDSLLRESQKQLCEKDAQICMLQEEMKQLRQEASLVKKVAKKPPGPRNWSDMKCQKILECGGECRSVATKADLIAVGTGVWGGIKLYSKTSNKLLCEIRHDQLGSDLWGATFLDEQTIVVSDLLKHNVKILTTKEKLLRTIDRGKTSFDPRGITVSLHGHIYVCDGANHCVCVFDVKGKSLFSFGSHGSGDECFDCPRDLCFASDGLLYITDVKNSRICVCNEDGKFIRKFPAPCEPTCIDVTDCGHLIVSSFSSDKVMIYTTGGELINVFGESGRGLGQFSGLCGVSVDNNGVIYIVDMNNHRIQML